GEPVEHGNLLGGGLRGARRLRGEPRAALLHHPARTQHADLRDLGSRGLRLGSERDGRAPHVPVLRRSTPGLRGGEMGLPRDDYDAATNHGWNLIRVGYPRIKSDDACNRRRIVFSARFRLGVTWVLLAATGLLGGGVQLARRAPRWSARRAR